MEIGCFCHLKIRISNLFRISDFGFRILVLITLCSLLATLYCFADEIKEPNVAGAFYPDDQKELSGIIDGFLNTAAPEPMQGEIFALISPHAGYGFSGQTAAYGYKLVRLRPYKTVIVIGTSHQFGFSGVSVYPKGTFRTPLGDLEIDDEFAGQLINKDQYVFFEPRAFAKEHSVEVQLPFLQKTLSDFKIVPVVMGDCTFSICKKFAELLKAAIGERKDVLVVASSDLYHGYDYEEAESVDSRTLNYLEGMDYEGLYYGIREGGAQACGGFAVVSALLLAREMGHDQIKILHHTNSALVTGRQIKGIWTVGYVSCAIDQDTSGNQKGVEAMLNKEQKKRLLEIARGSVKAYLETGDKLKVTEEDPVLNQEMGAFVTLHKDGQLRGCIGNLVGEGPLYLAVRDMAVQSACFDHRFQPVELSELDDIEIEISALSPLKRIENTDEIQMGTHGVIVKKGYHSGVFLPQVATETGWPKEEFLSNLCAHKAGLPADAWRDKSTEIYIFTAEVFSE